MGKGKIHLTREGFDKLQEELEYLKGPKRREISKEIAEARALGDLSENAEYHAAREAQGMNEKRVAEIEDTLSRAQILDESQMASDEALIGATVTIRDLDSDDEFDYFLVSEEESDFDSGKISITSPVGKAILGCKVGETVEINVPAGTLKYEIIKIKR